MATFPNTPLLDTFDRASLGSTWTSGLFGDATSLAIAGSTQLQTTSVSTTAASGAVLNTTTGLVGLPAEIYFQVPTLDSTGRSVWGALWYGTLASPNGYELNYFHQTSGNNLFVSRSPAGTTLLSIALSGGLTAGHWIGMQLQASGANIAITVWEGATVTSMTQVGTVTDSTSPQVGPYGVGMEILGQNWRLDNLGGGQVLLPRKQLRVVQGVQRAANW